MVVAIALLYSVVKAYLPSLVWSFFMLSKNSLLRRGTEFWLTATILQTLPFIKFSHLPPLVAPCMKMLIFSRTIESGRLKISPLSSTQLITAYSHSSMIFKASSLLSSLSFLRIFAP